MLLRSLLELLELLSLHLEAHTLMVWRAHVDGELQRHLGAQIKDELAIELFFHARKLHPALVLNDLVLTLLLTEGVLSHELGHGISKGCLRLLIRVLRRIVTRDAVNVDPTRFTSHRPETVLVIWEAARYPRAVREVRVDRNMAIR